MPLNRKCVPLRRNCHAAEIGKCIPFKRNLHNGILHMCKDQSKLLIEDISKTCIDSSACRYSYFKRLLKERTEGGNRSVTKNILPTHENLRGKEEYK